MSNSMEKSNSGPAWAAAIAAFATIIVTLTLSFFDQSAQRHERLLEHRRQALFAALHVIDLVYANEPLNNAQPAHPHPFDLQSARDADNEMRIYCQYPETVVEFQKALGLHSTNDRSPGVDLAALDLFRKQVAKELDLPNPVGLDENRTWIANLDGAQ